MALANFLFTNESGIAITNVMHNIRNNAHHLMESYQSATVKRVAIIMMRPKSITRGGIIHCKSLLQ